MTYWTLLKMCLTIYIYTLTVIIEFNFIFFYKDDVKQSINVYYQTVTFTYGMHKTANNFCNSMYNYDGEQKILKISRNIR